MRKNKIKCPPALRETVEWMLHEFKTTQLTVTLVPNRDGDGCIRAVSEENPKWYRSICSTRPSSRRRRKAAFDTAVKRANVMSAFTGLLNGGTRSQHAQEIIEWAEYLKEESGDQTSSL